MTKDRFDIGIGLIALQSIVLAGWTLKQRLSRPQFDLSQIPRIEEWQHVAAIGHEVGYRTAPDTIVEFSDFECPFCAQTYHSLKAPAGC
ncbi:MAG: DsbA family protein [Gemmatimonadaceae bacterium]